MPDVEEIEIKIAVDDAEVKKALADSSEVTESKAKTGGGKASDIIGKGAQDTGDTVFDEAKYHGAFGAAQGAVKNPMGMITKFLPKFLGKMIPKLLTKAIPIVGVALLAAEIVPMIIKEVIKQLTSVGAPFDKRFRRIIKNEVNGFFTREEQQRRRLGMDQVIMTSVIGFRNNGGLQTVNTLNEVREQGIAPIGLTMKAQGVVP